MKIYGDLPIASNLAALTDALSTQGHAVLQAPPGAGKTTSVPLSLLSCIEGRIVMLEPRRLAARAAAARMSQVLGENIGQTVGYRIRGESCTSRETRIEVVTEGILTRMLQHDPALEGVGCVIFDEFHERSLNADLGLALVLETRQALRPDLKLLVMSATLDAAPVASLMGNAPLITSEGRAWPVETRWLPRPLPTGHRFPDEMARLIIEASQGSDGAILAFLPGEGEIRKVQKLLEGRLPGIDIQTLFGAMDFQAQQAVLQPRPGSRKLILATSIAETSLTIPDVRVVVDGGRARRSRFDPGSGMSRLVTERASRAEAEQRRGRAGRVAEGICWRLWSKAEEGALPAFPPAEIESADLTGLALELALWGSDEGLQFLTPPPAGALAEARALLETLGALRQGRITDHGRAMAALPVHPRLAHMLLVAGPDAAPLAALLSDRDPIRDAPPDLGLRLQALDNLQSYLSRHPWPVNRDALNRINQEARRLRRLVSKPIRAGLSAGAMAALAFPDRIGLRRKGDAPRWVLSGGKGATMAPGMPLSGIRILVATDLDGDNREAGIRQALPLSEAELRDLMVDQLQKVELCTWSRREGRVMARRQLVLGALALEDMSWPDPPPERIAMAALEGLRDELRQGNGLPFSGAAARLRARAEAAIAAGIRDIPAVDDDTLMEDADSWLLPELTRARTRGDLRSLDLLDALRTYLGWNAVTTIDGLYPSHFTTPLGRRIPIDHDGDQPGIELRIQELFGQRTHPCVGPARTPLRLSLLSPGGKPIAVTSDLPGFWKGSYADVRKDMRGRYPRHPWPEDPTEADPTLRAKPRGT